jgi:predicted DsbA family dithiol-disulfide isomerase
VKQAQRATDIPAGTLLLPPPRLLGIPSSGHDQPGSVAMTSAEKPPVIEVFADIWCPYTHVGLKMVAEQLKTRGQGQVRLRVRSWPLEWVNGRAMDVQAAVDHIDELQEQVAPDLFAGFDAAQFPHSTIPVLALVAGAYRAGLDIGEAVSFEARDWLFERGADVSEPDTLAAIARSHGLSPPDPDDYAAVVADWKEGRSRGVAGSPPLLLCRSGRLLPIAEDLQGGGRRAPHHRHQPQSAAGVPRRLSGPTDQHGVTATGGQAPKRGEPGGPPRQQRRRRSALVSSRRVQPWCPAAVSRLGSSRCVQPRRPRASFPG